MKVSAPSVRLQRVKPRPVVRKPDPVSSNVNAVQRAGRRAHGLHPRWVVSVPVRFHRLHQPARVPTATRLAGSARASGRSRYRSTDEKWGGLSPEQVQKYEDWARNIYSQQLATTPRGATTLDMSAMCNKSLRNANEAQRARVIRPPAHKRLHEARLQRALSRVRVKQGAADQRQT